MEYAVLAREPPGVPGSPGGKVGVFTGGTSVRAPFGL